MDQRHLVVWLCLVTLGAGQLVCEENHTYEYKYANDIKMWGDIKQSYYVSCTVEIDCIGVSTISKPGNPAYDFTLHVSNYKVKEGRVRPEDVLKLCKKTQQTGSSCGVDNPNYNPGEDVTATDNGLFDFPAVFTQRNDGKILRILFMEKDLENRDVMNLKKGIVSALQTHLSEKDGDETEEETDSTGTHRTQYNSTKNSDGVVIKKQFNSKDDADSSKSNIPAEIQLQGETRVQQGEIMSSRGKMISEASKEDEDEDVDERPGDIVTGIDVGDVLNTESSYNLDLASKRKRSAHRQRRMAEYKTVQFLEDSILIETEENIDDSRYDQLEMLYGHLRQLTLLSILNNFTSSKDDSFLKPIKQIIILESELGYDKIRNRLHRTEPPLVDQLVPETYGVVSECSSSWDICRELLSLYSLGGGLLTEQVFGYLMTTDSPLSPEQEMELIDIVSFLVNPSNDFVTSVIGLYELPSNVPDKSQALLLAVGALAGQTSVSEVTKLIVVRIILAELETLTNENCPEETRIINALEAVGNMADLRLLQQVFRVASNCGQSKNVRLAVVHAVRGLLSHPGVEDLLLDTLLRFDCDVTSDLVEILKESIDDSVSSQSHDWPLEGLNQVDSFLIDSLTNSSHLECLRKVSISYFKAKKSPDTHQIVDALLQPSSSSVDDSSRQKRGVEHYSCNGWSDYNGRYSAIQSRNTFIYDTKTYNRRRHCLGHFRIGASKARADFYAGYFVGYKSPSSTVRSKVFGKFVAKGKIFGKTIDLANIYSYFTTNGLYASGRVYARVGGKTLLSRSFSTASYSFTKYYSNSLRIPLFRIPLYITSINFDLTLTAKLRLNIRLNACSSNSVCLQLIPTALPSASAGASLSLIVIRGGVDLSVNFNYYVKGEVRVNVGNRKTCVNLSHGYDKNNISIDFWYQLRTKLKIKLWPPWKFKISFRWGAKKTWTPSKLKWSIGGASEKKIYTTC